MKKNHGRFTAVFLIMFFSLLALPCAGLSQPAAKATLEIAPLSGAPASAITLKGKGFKPEEEVDILFVLDESVKVEIGTAKVDIVKADAAGNFSVEAAIPVNAKPGKYTIEVYGSKDSETTTTIEVTPKK